MSLAGVAFAGSVFKCVDPTTKTVTFSDVQCSNNATIVTVHDAPLGRGRNEAPAESPYLRNQKKPPPSSDSGGSVTLLPGQPAAPSGPSASSHSHY